MPYQAPGVKTIVTIGNTTVTLPAGTRILSLIGNSDRTVFVTAEAQVQPSNLLVQVANSGLTSVSEIYDFSGPGNSQYQYLPAASGAYGSGYFLSGNFIGWTPAVNPYPASVTPAIGSTFNVTYNYSGVAFKENHIVPTLASGTGNILNIANVTNIVSVSGTVGSSIIAFSGIAQNPSGAGYYLAGNSLLWSQGTYSSFAVAQADGFVPSGQSTIYVNYNYSGISTSETQIQNSGHSEELGIAFSGGNVLGIISVSNTNTNFYVSGTVNPIYSGNTWPFDTLGYGISGTGYLQSGNYINWSAATNNGFPYATVPPVNDVIYIDYEYTKSSNAYVPQSFATFGDVVNAYGQIADWTLITTGPNAGTYQLANVNPLVLGAQIAFDNNAPIVTLVQNQGAGTTGGDYLASLNLLQTKTVDLIVPLTFGSGLAAFVNGVNTVPNNTGTNGNMSTANIAEALYYADLHCDTMSSPDNKMERVALGSLGAAEIGDINTPNTYIYTASVALDDKRIALVAPGTCTIQLQDPNGNYQNVNVDGSLLAVAVAALSANPNSDVATPLTNQELTDFSSISAQTPGHPSTDYVNVEMNNLAAAGVMVIAAEGPRIFVRQQLTTDQTNPIVGEFSVVTLADYVSQAVRSSCNQYIGKKLVPAITIPSVKGTILATLQALAAADIISSFGAVTCQINSNNPTQLLVSAAYVPIFPLNQIIVTFTLNTLG